MPIGLRDGRIADCLGCVRDSKQSDGEILCRVLRCIEAAARTLCPRALCIASFVCGWTSLRSEDTVVPTKRPSLCDVVDASYLDSVCQKVTDVSDDNDRTYSRGREIL